MTVIREQLQAIVDETGLPFVNIDAGSAAGTEIRFSATRDLSPSPEAALCLTASLTKPIVAMAVLQCGAEGRLALSQRIGDWLPEFRTRVSSHHDSPFADSHLRPARSVARQFGTASRTCAAGRFSS